MSVKIEKFTISTKGFDDIIDITSKIQGIVSGFDVKDALLSVFVAASTASVVTIEYEPGLVVDLPELLNTLVPINRVYEHDKKWHDGNGYSHLRSTLLGNSLTIPVVNGKLELGSWQQIVLVDFDNKPRVREIIVTAIF